MSLIGWLMKKDQGSIHRLWRSADQNWTVLRKKFFKGIDQIRLSPAAIDFEEARRWLGDHGSNLGGVIAQDLQMEYQSGNRTGTMKIKRVKTATVSLVDSVIW